ncbi:phospholipase D-like domain-containing protein [Cupriavidus plantarum]|uniref:Cardiolipin synthase n=1 Tax=Cupriavidus plantarum TaxID=942865 RepID=A0A316ESU0_9BURK|nr:phospholipase D-like domain-containing protein [Cupriavidus plantarum]NYI00335.1 cardiolipin synthase [Cupriavidus plantarum]PWK34745.1 cardiolipin synthase [Cupriavidus plantarum]REE93188.1 cardiolipin synthase [Cupriavidus plantarum]RLK38620.1 cardiolipin synthase [Cupriavidus plantarum]CAG2138187.1 putative cardiolipin synthase YwiE [Cupriavidus plantarum]
MSIIGRYQAGRAPRTAISFVALVALVVLSAICGAVVWNIAGDDRHIERRVDRLYSLEDPQFAHELGVLLGPPVVDGNRYRVLRNGDEIFPAMLEAIRRARKTINFESYIYWSGDIGMAFAEALSERARHGVKVQVLLDAVGSAKVEQSVLDTMTNAGVDVRMFHPVRWYTLSKLNNRTHRKLLIVDGTVGFTGGVGIAPEWTGHAQDPDHWRDTHFEVEGPVVGQMQAVFVDNWIKVAGRVSHGPEYFPLPKPAGEGRAQMFSSSPTGGSESMALMYQLAITAAKSSIDLSAAYFVPDRVTEHALLAAIDRGVRVRIIVPGEHIDSETVRAASRQRWGELLKRGVLIAEYKPTMYHCKVMIVDGLLVSVGSTNFDNRSFRLNDEATLNILDPKFAAEQTAIFEDDLKRSQPITYDAWKQRPLRQKFADALSSLIGAQL